MERGQYGRADKKARASLKIRRELLGIDDTATLYSTDMLTLVLQHQGKSEQAAEINQRALTKEMALGVDHPDTLISVNNLALALRYQGKYEQAEDMNRRGTRVTYAAEERRRRRQILPPRLSVGIWNSQEELNGNCGVKHRLHVRRPV